jgi:hypothetical protein
MNIVVYDKVSGRVKILSSGVDPSTYDSDIYDFIEVDNLPSLDSKVVDGVILPIEVGDYPERELEEAWFALRSKRRYLLKESDWTTSEDSPVNDKPAWIAYRQNLRDITEQSEAPFNVIWPVEPIE